MQKASRKVRDVKIAVERAAGLSCRELGKRYDLSKQTISDICARGDIKQFIEEITTSLALNEGMTAYQNVAHCINAYQKKKTNELPKEDRIQLKDHGFKASVKVLESLGVLESQKTSISIQNITNTQNNVVSPMMSDLIKKHLGLGPEVIEMK